MSDIVVAGALWLVMLILLLVLNHGGNRKKWSTRPKAMRSDPIVLFSTTPTKGTDRHDLN